MSEFSKGVDRRTVLGGLGALTLGGSGAFAAVPALPSAPVGINIIAVGGALGPALGDDELVGRAPGPQQPREEGLAHDAGTEDRNRSHGR